MKNIETNYIISNDSNRVKNVFTNTISKVFNDPIRSSPKADKSRMRMSQTTKLKKNIYLFDLEGRTETLG